MIAWFTTAHRYRRLGRWNRDVPPSKPPFRPHFSSRDPPFQALFQLQKIRFHFLKKSRISRSIFADFELIFSSWDADDSKISFQRPQFPVTKSIPETFFFWKPGRHIYNYPNFCRLPPPPGTEGGSQTSNTHHFLWVVSHGAQIGGIWELADNRK